MPRLEPLPPELAGHPFAIARADALGIPRGRLRRSDLVTPVSGVRAPRASPPGDAIAPWERARLALVAKARIEAARMPPGSAFSHVTAAALHDLPLRSHRFAKSAVVDVTADGDDTRRRRKGVRCHPLGKDLARVVAVDGMPATHPIDTWCALSATLSIDELVELGDHLVQRQHPVATLDELRRAVFRYTGRHGVKRLRAAMELVRPRTDSVRETRVRLLLTGAGLPEPEVNVSVTDARGQHIKLGDLVYRRHRVLVEYDGEQHRVDDRQYAKDAADLEAAFAAGWLVIRIRKADLDRHPTSIVASVRSALASRALLPLPSLAPHVYGRDTP